jgi:DNA-binding XRE family transcriptional regulator
MENRIFQPMISIFIVLILYKLLSNEALNINQLISKLIVLFVLPLSIFISVFDFKNISNNYQLRSHDNQFLNTKIRDTARGKILVPDYFVFIPMFFYSNRPFEQFEFKSFKNVFMLDIETYSLTPDYVTYLNKHCNCNSKDLASFFDYLFSIKEQVLIAGNERRIRVFENYLKLVRKRRYHFVRNKQIEGNELTQNELAQKAGLTQATISSLESNRISLGVERAKSLAKVLHVHPAVLLFPDWEHGEQAA